MNNELLLFLLTSVMIQTAFMAVALVYYQGAPDIVASDALRDILMVFEG